MPASPTRNRAGSPVVWLVSAVPIALAALLLPALFILIPSRQAAQITGATTVASSGPAEVHLTVKEWSFVPASLQLPIGTPVTLVLFVTDTAVTRR